MKIIWMLDDVNTMNGMVQVVIGLSNHFVDKGHNVRIYSLYSKESKPFFYINPTVIVENLGRNWGDTSRFDKHRILGQIMKNSDADILLTCNEWANSSSVFHKSKFKGKVILTQHLTMDCFSTRRKVINGIFHRFADAVVVLTEYDKSFYERHKARNVIVIPNAVYASPQAADRQKIITAVGRIEPIKGFDMLISAFAQIAKDFPEWKLFIWGNGSQREPLLDLVKEEGMTEQIKLPGATNQVGRELSKSSVFALSSIGEGLPLAMIEAMAAGNAIVAFDLPCTKDILTPNCGLIVPQKDVAALAEALQKMMSDDILRKNCGAGAYAASRKYSIENIGQMWFDLFDRLMNG